MVRVYAAASLRESCEEIGRLWNVKHPRTELVFNFGASNALAQQILASQKAEVFLSADPAQLDALRKANLVVNVTRSGWLSNQLVVVVPSTHDSVRIDSAADLARPEFAKLSIANPDAVPAGKYAKAWLTSSNVWAQVEARIVPGIDVRSALAAVESEAADVGIVYSTDAAITDRVRVALRVATSEGPKIEYVGAVLTKADNRQPSYDADGKPAHEDNGIAVLDFFAGDEAKKVFERRGFIVGELH